MSPCNEMSLSTLYRRWHTARHVVTSCCQWCESCGFVPHLPCRAFSFKADRPAVPASFSDTQCPPVAYQFDGSCCRDTRLCWQQGRVCHVLSSAPFCVCVIEVLTLFYVFFYRFLNFSVVFRHQIFPHQL